MIPGARTLRPLRLLVPLVAIAAALALFLGLGFVAFSLLNGPPPNSRYCDAGFGAVAGPLGRAAAAMTAADLSDEQRSNAATIIAVARNLDAPPRAWVIALATAMQESTLRNIAYGDRDSLGLFQQRPSQGWGTPTQVLDPVYSTSIFIQRLLQVPRWDELPLTVAAQTVQRSAFPDAYAKWERLASELVQNLSGVAISTGCGPTALLADGVARTAISFALGELGKPYLWGGTGPDRYDCSGLLLRAFQAAGINLPRVSREQFYAGGHIPVQQAQPGDLLFYATDPRDPSTIHHVAMYIGDGNMVEAPYTGEVVRVRPVPWGYAELVPLATRPGTTPSSA